MINPPAACGDDGKARPVNGLDQKPPAAMILMHSPDRPLFKKMRFLMRANRMKSAKRSGKTSAKR